MRSVACVCAVALLTAAVLPRPALAGAALFASDQNYFAPKGSDASDDSSSSQRVVYETLGSSGLTGLVAGLLGLGADAEYSGSIPGWVNAEELARAPPQVVLVHAGAASASGKDLASEQVSNSVRKALAGARSAVTAPHAALEASAEDATGGASFAARVLGALTKARQGGSKTGGHFVAGECGDGMAGDGAVTLKQAGPATGSLLIST
jgi:hypothetical protein